MGKKYPVVLSYRGNVYSYIYVLLTGETKVSKSQISLRIFISAKEQFYIDTMAKLQAERLSASASLKKRKTLLDNIPGKISIDIGIFIQLSVIMMHVKELIILF